eukprot:3005965-Rhodomonas_salina.1
MNSYAHSVLRQRRTARRARINLIDEAAAASDFVLLGVELGALVADLAEQTLGPAARAARIVDPHVVIFRVHGFLDKRFRNLLPVAHDVVLELLRSAPQLAALVRNNA